MCYHNSISLKGLNKMKNKLALLKEYVEKQSDDDWIWCINCTTIIETYLQEELRRVRWLIESATIEQIQDAIDNYDKRYD